MKILIAIVVLALIYFIYKKMSADKSASSSNDQSAITAGAEQQADTVVTTATASASEAGDTNAALDSSSGAATQAAAAAVVNNDLPLEHLVGIDRRAGKALRALDITDMSTLLAAGSDKLEAAGFGGAAAAALKAQASLSSLPGVTPQEAAVLAGSGIDSVAKLAQQDPEQLMETVTRITRATGALKSAPGAQQLQRLISSAKAAV